VVRPAPEGGLMMVRLTETSHFRPPHDRRHQLNLQARYSSGPYSASVRWHFGSGLPYTPIHGYYESARPASPDDQEFLHNPGSVEVAFAEPYSHRLPAYHRLDVSAERDFTFTGWRLIIQAGVINLYDRENIFSYDLLLGRRVNQLPLIPSLGIRVEVI
jgi:outer membrane receptor protein involved in Fe transport